jgi:hypothetical protein
VALYFVLVAIILMVGELWVRHYEDRDRDLWR